MSIEVIYGDHEATFATRPEFGLPVTFVVSKRKTNITRGSGWAHRARHESRYVVHLKGSEGAGFSHHVSFETACQRALSRAKRYDTAYSKPRRTLVSA